MHEQQITKELHKKTKIDLQPTCFILDCSSMVWLKKKKLFHILISPTQYNSSGYILHSITVRWLHWQYINGYVQGTA